jgi:hypothetical protein
MNVHHLGSVLRFQELPSLNSESTHSIGQPSRLSHVSLSQFLDSRINYQIQPPYIRNAIPAQASPCSVRPISVHSAVSAQAPQDFVYSTEHPFKNPIRFLPVSPKSGFAVLSLGNASWTKRSLVRPRRPIAMFHIRHCRQSTISPKTDRATAPKLPDFSAPVRRIIPAN